MASPRGAAKTSVAEVSKGRASTLCSAGMRDYLRVCNKEEGRARRPAPLRQLTCLAADYQVPPVGQPPWPAAEHVRVVVPSSALVMVKSIPDFEFAFTM